MHLVRNFFFILGSNNELLFFVLFYNRITIEVLLNSIILHTQAI